MTQRQKEMFDFIKSYCKQKGYAPDYLEIMEAIHIKSKSQVHYLLNQLEAEGKIIIKRGKTRGIEIVSSKSKTIQSLKKQLEYAERVLRVINETTADSGTANYAYDALLKLRKVR